MSFRPPSPSTLARKTSDVLQAMESLLLYQNDLVSVRLHDFGLMTRTHLPVSPHAPRGISLDLWESIQHLPGFRAVFSMGLRVDFQTRHGGRPCSGDGPKLETQWVLET